MGTIVKGPIGVEDVDFKDSGTSRQTFTRTDSTGRTLTLNQIDAGDIQFRSVAKQIEDLVDGGYDVTLKLADIITKSPQYDVRVNGAVGDGATDDRAAIFAADAAAGASGILFAPGTYKISSNLTITHATFMPGAKLSIDTGVVVTINGLVAAPLQIISGLGTVTLADGAVDEVYPEWWGIDGTADEVEINQAITASPAGGLIKLLNKSYVIAASVSIEKNIRMDGSNQGEVNAGSQLEYNGITAISIAQSNSLEYVSLSNFELEGTANASNIGILAGKNSTSKSLAEYDFRNLFVLGGASTVSANRGVGIDLGFALKGLMENCHTFGFTNGIKFDGDTGVPAGSNANLVSRCSARGNLIGINFPTTGSGGSFISGCTTEGNGTGIQCDGGNIMLWGNHFENDSVGNKEQLVVTAGTVTSVGNAYYGADNSKDIMIESGSPTVTSVGDALGKGITNAGDGNETFHIIAPVTRGGADVDAASRTGQLAITSLKGKATSTFTFSQASQWIFSNAVDFSAAITAVGITLTGALILGNRMSGTPDEITSTSEGVAAATNTVNTEVTTNGDADLDNVTLANGVEGGQMKSIYCVVAGNAGDSFKITPANMVGGTQITFAADPTGKGCTLRYADNEGWVVVGNNGGTIS